MGDHFSKKIQTEKKSKVKPLAIIVIAFVCIIVIGLGTMFIINKQKEEKRQEEIVFQTKSLALAKEKRLEEERIAAEIAEQERIAAEKAEQERIAAEKAEQERIAAEKAEQERIAAEKAAAKKKAQEAARKAAEADKARAEQAKKEAALKEQQRAAEEKARLAAEKTERSKLSALIKSQELRLQAEQNEYYALMPEAIVNLPVETIMQNPELPNGCEIVSLAIVLNYLGHYVDKTMLSDLYLPKYEFRDVNKQRVGGDPNSVYCGNPRYKSGGYYCFAPPLVQAANSFMSTLDSDYRAIDATGADEAFLLSSLDAGNPVVAFTTLSMGDPVTYEPSKWIINGTNQTHVPFLNLHCVVLHGYDEEFIYIADPLKGNIKCRRSSFMSSFKGIGSRAVVFTQG